MYEAVLGIVVPSTRSWVQLDSAALIEGAAKIVFAKTSAGLRILLNMCAASLSCSHTWRHCEQSAASLYPSNLPQTRVRIEKSAQGTRLSLVTLPDVMIAQTPRHCAHALAIEVWIFYPITVSNSRRGFRLFSGPLGITNLFTCAI